MVHVAPAPVLAGLGGLDHRVLGLAEVRGRVPRRGGVAAARRCRSPGTAAGTPTGALVEALPRRPDPVGGLDDRVRLAGRRRSSPVRRSAGHHPQLLPLLRRRCRASTPRRRASPARPRRPRRRPCPTCGSPAPGRRSASSISSRSREYSSLGVSWSAVGARAAPRPRSCAARAAAGSGRDDARAGRRTRAPRALEPGLGRLLEQRRPGPARPRAGRAPATFSRRASHGSVEPCRSRVPGHDREGDQQQHLAVLGVLGDRRTRPPA